MNKTRILIEILQKNDYSLSGVTNQTKRIFIYQVYSKIDEELKTIGAQEAGACADFTKNICIGGTVTGFTCYPTRGSPLVIGNNSGVYCLYGIGSRVASNCSAVSVFTRVSAYEKWINDKFIGL